MTKEDVLRVIDEPAAIGTYFWNRYDSKTGEELPEEDWIVIPCEPIIDRELWDLAQKVRKERDPKRSAGRTGSSPLLLAGIIFCGKCGASYQLETSGKAPPQGGREYRYYNCRSFCRTGRDKCAGARIPTADLDKAVVEHLADQLFTEERCQLLLKDILQETGMLRRKVNEQLRLMQAELESVEKKLRVWQEAFENGTLPADLGLERVTELRARRDELRETLTKVVPIQPPPPHIFAPANVKRFREHIRGIFMGGDNALTKHYIRHLVARIEVTDAHIRVFGKIEAVAQLLAEKRLLIKKGGRTHPGEESLPTKNEERPCPGASLS